MDRLLGNGRLMQSLSAAFAADRLSHCYLIAGPEGSGKRTLARFLAAAMQCTEGAGRPCGRCLQCRKVFANHHPDVIWVEELKRAGSAGKAADAKEPKEPKEVKEAKRKTVGVELIRKTRADVYIRPNEGRRKVYIFPRAMDMTPPAQNALLKVIEEPPEYAAFLLLTDGAERVLPTIRSRGVLLQLSPLTEEECLPALAREFPDLDREALRTAWERADGYYGRAASLLRAGEGLAPETQTFADCFARRDRLGLTELLVRMEKLQRDQLIPLFEEWTEVLTGSVAVRSGLSGGTEAAVQIGRMRAVREIMEAVGHIRRASELAQGNANVGSICGALQIWLEN